MTVIVLIAAKPGLRGHLTRWMIEIAPGVFVGTLTARIRERLWRKNADRIGSGQAVIIHTAQNEQRWVAQTAGCDRWLPADLDGLTLFLRPSR